MNYIWKLLILLTRIVSLQMISQMKRTKIRIRALKVATQKIIMIKKMIKVQIQMKKAQWSNSTTSQTMTPKKKATNPATTITSFPSSSPKNISKGWKMTWSSNTRDTLNWSEKWKKITRWLRWKYKNTILNSTPNGKKLLRIK